MITWKDLFDFESASTETKKAVKEINNLDKAYKRWIQGMQTNQKQLSTTVSGLVKQMEELNKSLKKLNPSTEKNRQAITQASKQSEVATAQYKKLTATIESQSKQITKLKSEQEKVSKSREDSNKKMSEQEKLQLKLKKASSEETREITKLKVQIAEKNREVRKDIKESLKSADAYEKLKQNTNRAQLEFKRMAAQYGVNSKQAKSAQKEFSKFDDELRSINEGAKDGRRDVGRYGTAFSGLKGMIGQAGAAMKAFLANPVVAVIGAIVGAFMLLKSALTRSEEGQDRLNKIMTIAGSVMDNILDLVTDLAIYLVDMFKNPQEALQSFGQMIVENVVNRFKAVADIGGILGRTLKLLFQGEFSAAAEEAGNLGGALVQVVTGLDEVQRSKAADAFKEIGKEIKADAESANELADNQARYNKLEREFLVENERLRAKSAKARAEAEKTKRTDAKESMRLLNESFDIDEKVLQNELELQQLRVQNLKQKSALAADDIEAKKEIAEAEAELFRIETKFDEVRRQRTRRLNSTRDEALKQERERTKAEIQILEARSQEEIRANESVIESTNHTLERKELAIKRNLDIQQELLKQETDLELAELESRNDLKLISEDNYNAQKQALIEERIAGEKELEYEAQETIADLKNDFREQEIEKEKEQLELQMEFIEAKKQAEIEFQNVRNAAIMRGLNIARMAFNQESTIGRALFALQKGLAIANIVTNTASSIAQIKAATAASISKAVAASPLTGGLPWTAINTAIGAKQIASAKVSAGTQIAAIAASAIPRYADGTDYHGGGLAVVGDGGRSEVISDKRGGAWITPDRPTLVDMPKGYQVFDSLISAQQSLGSMEVNKDGALGIRKGLQAEKQEIIKAQIKAQSKLNHQAISEGIRKGLSDMEVHQTYFNDGDITHHVRKGNTKYNKWRKKHE